jgi:exonuclease SbcD
VPRFRFIHAADIHLGYEQYNLPARANDFARAFLEMVAYAVDKRADFVLIAGDLFHRSSADAWMLKQATAGLWVLRDARIPAIAIEGNHDAQHAKKNLSWMEFLCDQELLVLLNVDVADNGYKQMVQFDPGERRGSWIDVAGARIYGMKYYGAATARYLEEVRDQIEPAASGYTILALHAGIDGQVPHLHGGLTMGQLEPLKKVVDYLALGHVHKQLKTNWIFNPGSTETNSVEEMEWPHGFFDVSVDTDGLPKHNVEHIDTAGLRPFCRITVNADGTETLESFTDLIEQKIEEQDTIPKQSVVELQVGGISGFNRQHLPTERLKTAVERRFDPLVVRIRNTLAPPGMSPVRDTEHMGRHELERSVVEQIVRSDSSRRDRVDTWTRLTLDVKNMAANRDTAPATIVDYVRSSLAAMDSKPAQLSAGEEATSQTSEHQASTEATDESADLAEMAGAGARTARRDGPQTGRLFEDW